MTRTMIVSVLSLCLASAVGCGRTSSEAASESEQASRSSYGDPVGSPDERGEDREVTVAAGTVVTIEFDDSVSTESSDPGDHFAATVIEPVYVDQELAIDRGSRVHGKVVDVNRGKKIGGKAKLTLEFTALELPNGEQTPIDATLYSAGKSQAGKDAATIGGSAAGGAILGRIIGHQSDQDDEGTAIGAVVGAAIGTAIAAGTDGQPVTIPAGTSLSIQLDSPVRVTA